nr:uncharacterized protein LOC131276571 [Dasypus novemcinctus]
MLMEKPQRVQSVSVFVDVSEGKRALRGLFASCVTSGKPQPRESQIPSGEASPKWKTFPDSPYLTSPQERRPSLTPTERGVRVPRFPGRFPASRGAGWAASAENRPDRTSRSVSPLCPLPPSTLSSLSSDLGWGVTRRHRDAPELHCSWRTRWKPIGLSCAGSERGVPGTVVFFHGLVDHGWSPFLVSHLWWIKEQALRVLPQNAAARDPMEQTLVRAGSKGASLSSLASPGTLPQSERRHLAFFAKT